MMIPYTSIRESITHNTRKKASKVVHDKKERTPESHDGNIERKQ